MEIGSNEAIKQSVQAGLGLLSRATIEQELTLKRLTVLDVADFPIMRDWYVVYRKGKRLSAAAEAFKTYLINEINAAEKPVNKPSTPRPKRNANDG